MVEPLERSSGRNISHRVLSSGAVNPTMVFHRAIESWANDGCATNNRNSKVGRRILPPALKIAEHVGRCARWSWMISRHPRYDTGGFMSGWCNGTAGFVFLWRLAHTTFKNEQFLVLAEKSAWHAWKGNSELGNLCCGLSGQAYALLRFYKDTDENVWLRRAEASPRKRRRRSTQYLKGGYEALAERPDSLYKGDALLVAELEKPQFAAMPFFEAC